jgi:hypothetical protein
VLESVLLVVLDLTTLVSVTFIKVLEFTESQAQVSS